MNEFPNRFDTPEDAYFGFFRADNAHNPKAWADVMSYPHVRVSARSNPAFYPTPADYADAADWSPREATGWVRSQGVGPIRAQQSDNKVHLLGGWTRFNASDEPILENRVTYILTRIDGSWGIQARFGIDSFTGQDEEDSVSSATSILRRFASHIADGDMSQATQLCRKPLTVVTVGDVQLLFEDKEIEALLAGNRGRESSVSDLEVLQVGTHGALIALTMAYSDGPDESGIALLGKRDDEWHIAGLSPIAY